MTRGIDCVLATFSLRSCLFLQHKYSNTPTIAASARAPAAAPPAIAATDVLWSGCGDVVADEDALAAVTPVDVGDEVADALEIVVEPPVA